jgi:NitT/TauT family transport system substrate-binding protein
MHKKLSRLLLLLLAGMSVTPVAFAETHTIRLARQYGIQFLPLVVMQHDALIEKEAKKAGLAPVTVKWMQFSGGSAVNDALISNNVDFVSGGVTPLITLWDKSKGMFNVRGVAAVSEIPLLLNTNQPRIHSLADFSARDRIALPSVKGSLQSILLEMAAAKAFGPQNDKKLDALTVSLPHPDAMIALLSGKSYITGHFTTLPYSAQELAHPGIHAVLNSYNVTGGPQTQQILYTMQKFHDENPRTYRVVMAALKDAQDIITHNPHQAAVDYVSVTREKVPVDAIIKMLRDPQVKFRSEPVATYKFAQFMYQTKEIRNSPASWKDYFFPEIYATGGS